ncbi:unnamed protein product [Rotaria magnacalcarata]|uniref:Uncharacterized protein n=1 Tax=Rotaria magnacalcarata TaxID=392030 RepID=A0A816YZ46_9BILA|nr:unnamed protein product [Rotaria magnacalcarata]CAF3936211.1 unnamed protein product [Rotaria magnacalcarata]
MADIPAGRLGLKNTIKSTSKPRCERFDIDDSTEVVVKNGKKLGTVYKSLLVLLAIVAMATAVIVPTVIFTQSKPKPLLISWPTNLSNITSTSTVSMIILGSTTVDISADKESTADVSWTATETTTTDGFTSKEIITTNDLTTNKILTSDEFTTTEAITNFSTTDSASIDSMTTTVLCPLDHVPTPSGTCVNTEMDFNNCGLVGFVCSSNYTMCLDGLCNIEPAVQLSGASAVANWLAADTDDRFVPLNMPFNITLYNYSTPRVNLTTNGIICLDGCSTKYTNEPLPSSDFNSPTAFGFWDDLKIYQSYNHAIYYAERGVAPYRRMIFEFYEGHYSEKSRYYRFQIIFYENVPNIVRYVYFHISDGGASATIGVQKSATGPYTTYSVNNSNAVKNGTSLIFDTIGGTFSG